MVTSMKQRNRRMNLVENKSHGNKYETKKNKSETSPVTFFTISNESKNSIQRGGGSHRKHKKEKLVLC